MKAFAHAFIVAILFVCAAGIASAQMDSPPPSFVGLWHAVVGSGAVYESVSPSKPKNTIQVEIVGKESVGGKDATWVQVSMQVPEFGNGNVVVKELVAIDPTAMQMQPFRMIIQLPGAAPMEMPTAMMGVRPPIQYSDARKNADDLGSEPCTSPAGTFTCEHYRAKDGKEDAWVSDKVIPFGLVKATLGPSDSITLVKTLTDSKDKITGAIQPFNPMLLMQQQQQRGAPPQR
jgi:hypothetical protein